MESRVEEKEDREKNVVLVVIRCGKCKLVLSGPISNHFYIIWVTILIAGVEYSNYALICSWCEKRHHSPCENVCKLQCENPTSQKTPQIHCGP